MNEAKIINLVDYIEQNKKVEGDISSFSNHLEEKLLLKRVYSFIIDIALIFTVHAAIMTCYILFVSEFYPSLSAHVKKDMIQIPLMVQLGLFLSTYIGYFMFTQAVMHGQTLGQKVYSLRVVNNQGQTKDDLKTISLRTMAYLMYYTGFGAFQLVFFMNKRSFADIISKTQLTCNSNQETNEPVVQIEIDSLKSVA